ETITPAPTASNFQFVGSGATGASVTGVTGSGKSWTITANAPTSGSLELDLTNSTGLTDSTAHAIVNVPFAGQSYTIGADPAPTVTSLTRSDPNPNPGPTLHWNVTFSEAVTGVNATNFTFAGSAAGSA